jgi:ubiquinol-cytochrome c reductase iron-sulfur subunit
VKRWLVAAIVLLLGRGRPRARLRARERIVQPGFPDRRAESVVLLLFLAAAVCAVGFTVVYALEGIPNPTQFLGLTLGLSLAFLAAASVLTGKKLVPQEEIAEPYPEPAHPEAQEQLEQLVGESGERITRKRLLRVAAGGATAALGAALVTPAASLGPALRANRLARSPWRRGIRLVDEKGRPLRADEIEADSFYTAFPQGADREQLGAPLVVVRLEPAELALPPGRKGWAPEGIVAYSKICTHAGCAIALYRTPLFEPTSGRPALVCPCHYSTFDPARGAKVLFGPAGRPLPQLPLAIDSRGGLVAAGSFSGRIGPSWWGVRFH